MPRLYRRCRRDKTHCRVSSLRHRQCELDNYSERRVQILPIFHRLQSETIMNNIFSTLPAYIVRGAGSMKISSVRPSVCLSVCLIVRQHQRRAAGLLQRWRGPALSSKREQCHVDSQGTRLNTDLSTL